MPKAVCGSNRPKRTASNSHWFALLLSCIGPVIPNTAKALEEEHPPTADSARYVVTTFADVTYFGAVAAAPDNPEAVVITPRTGAPQVVPNRQIAGKWLATDLAAYGPRQVVRSGCTGESRPRLLVREITAASQPPFLAKVLEVKVGDHIRVQRVDAAARDAQLIAWAELEQIRRPPDVADSCLPVASVFPRAPTPSGAGNIRIPGVILTIGGFSAILVGMLGGTVTAALDQIPSFAPCGPRGDAPCTPKATASQDRPLWPFGVSMGVGLTFILIGAPMWAFSSNAANAPR